MNIRIKLKGGDYCTLSHHYVYGYTLLSYLDSGKGVPKKPSKTFHANLRQAIDKLLWLGMSKEDTLQLNEVVGKLEDLTNRICSNIEKL